MAETDQGNPEERVDIRQLMQDGTAIDQAINEAIREAVLAHKRAGHPIVVCRDGQIVWIPAEEIEE